MKPRNVHVSWFVSAHDKKRMFDVVVVLIQIDTRLRRKAASSGKSAGKNSSRKTKENKAREPICLYTQGHGPCFFMWVFYLKAIEILNQGCSHDRYYRSHLNAEYVYHHQTRTV